MPRKITVTVPDDALAAIEWQLDRQARQRRVDDPDYEQTQDASDFVTGAVRALVDQVIRDYHTALVVQADQFFPEGTPPGTREAHRPHLIERLRRIHAGPAAERRKRLADLKGSVPRLIDEANRARVREEEAAEDARQAGLPGDR